MKEYQQRVVDEKVELDTKIARLQAFTQNREKFTALPKPEQERMIRQKSYMSEYSRVLGERIAAFDATPNDGPCEEKVESPLMRYFGYEGMPEGSQQLVTIKCHELACTMSALLADGPQREAGLRALLEAKDCFVRAAVPAKA